MTIEKLMELRSSGEAPFNHEEYTVWLHNKILDAVIYELWQFREGKAIDINSGYATCNHILKFSSLKLIK